MNLVVLSDEIHKSRDRLLVEEKRMVGDEKTNMSSNVAELYLIG